MPEELFLPESTVNGVPKLWQPIWKLILRHDKICRQTNKNPLKNKKVSERKS